MRLPSLALLGALTLGFTPTLPAQGTASTDVARAAARTLVRTVRLPGDLAPFEEVDLPARVAGYVRTIHVDLGDSVQAGTVLAEIDVPERAGEVAKANAEVARCRAEAAFRSTLLEQARQARAIDPGSISAHELARLEGEHAVALAEIEVATAELSRLQALLTLQQVRAPFAGRIVARHVSPGALVGADNGGPALFTLAQTHRLRCLVDVPEWDAPALAPGRSARIEVRATGRRFEATVTRVARRLEPSSRTLRIEIDLDNPEAEGAVQPGSFADVEVEVDQRSAEVAVPSSAVIGTADAPAVFVLVPGRDGQAVWQRRPVQIDFRGDEGCGIAGGLEAGDRVAVSARGLVDGQPAGDVREVSSW